MSATASGVNRYTCVITTVDPNKVTATGAPAPLVEGVIKSGKTIQISLYDIDNAFRWPVVGETWMVVQYNSSWYLEGLFPLQTQAANNYTNYNQGDLVLNSGSGKVAVVGSVESNGNNSDFELFYANNVLNYEHNGAVTPIPPPPVIPVIPTYTTGYAAASSGASIPNPQGSAVVLPLDTGIMTANGLSVANNAIVVPPGAYYIMAAVNVDPNNSSNGYGGVGFFAAQVYTDNTAPVGSAPTGPQIPIAFSVVSSAGTAMYSSVTVGLCVVTSTTNLSIASYWNETSAGPTVQTFGHLGVVQIGVTAS